MKKILAAVALCLFLSLPQAFAQASGDILKATLDNGLVVVINQMPDKDIAAMEILVRSGSIYEGEFMGSGLAHFLEHMLFKGTKTRPTGTIQREVKDLGAYFNAYTSHDYAGYYITGPKENLGPCLEILADAVLNSVFDSKEFEKERKVILREIAMGEDDPDRRFSRLIWSSVYTTHPYRHPVIGYEELLKKATLEDLTSYHAQRYVPNNMVLSIVSPNEPQEVLSDVKKAFSAFERKAVAPIALPQEPVQVAMRQVQETREDVELSRLALAYHTVPIGHEDLFALDVLAVIMGQGESSRLNQALRIEERLVYSVTSYNYTPAHPGLFVVNASLDESNIDNAKDAILAEIEKIKTKSIKAQELQKAKRQVLADYLYGLESPRGTSREMALNVLLTGNPEFSREYVDRINAVNAKKVEEVSRKYLTKGNLSILSLSPEGKNGARPQKNGARPRFSKIEKVELENGITLLVKEDKVLPIVSVQACFLGGLRFEGEEDCGIGSLMSSMLTKGTKTKSAEEIAIKLESMGASLSSYSGNNSFGISIKLISEDLEDGLKIFSDIVLNPAFAQDELELERARVLAAIRAQKEDVFQEGFDVLKKTIFQTHPYRLRLIGTEESIEGITTQALSSFHNRLVASEGMILAVFGDVDTKEVEKLVGKYFGSLNRRPKPEINAAIEDPAKKIRERIEYMPKQQALLLFGFLGTTIFDKDRYAVDALMSMLSGDAGSLYKKIRQEKGQAYTLGASSTFGLDPGYIYIYVATSPANIADVKQEVLEQVRIFSEEPVSDEELDLAKNDLIGEHRRNLQTNSRLALRTAIDELYGLGFNDYKAYEDRVRAVTKEDVMQAAKKYLRLEAHAFVTILPEEKAK